MSVSHISDIVQPPALWRLAACSRHHQQQWQEREAPPDFERFELEKAIVYFRNQRHRMGCAGYRQAKLPIDIRDTDEQGKTTYYIYCFESS